VHSLAAGLFLGPEQVHHFSDFGYRHAKFQYCAFVPTETENSQGMLVPRASQVKVELYPREELGYKCIRDPRAKFIDATCFNRIKTTAM
jgi:mannosyltransferase